MADPAPSPSRVRGAAGRGSAAAGRARGDAAGAAYCSPPASSTRPGLPSPAAGAAASGALCARESGSSSSIPAAAVTPQVSRNSSPHSPGTSSRMSFSCDSSASGSPSLTASFSVASPAPRSAYTAVAPAPVVAAVSSSSSSPPSSLLRSQQQSCSNSIGSLSPPHQQQGRPAAAPATGPAQQRPPQQQRSGDTSVHPSTGPVFGPSGGIAVTLRPSSGFAYPPAAPAALATSRGGSVAAAGSQQPRFSVYSSTRQTKVCPYCGPAGASGAYGGRSGGGAVAGAGSTIVFDASSGDQICRECGFVVEEKVLSEEQEWRNFSAEVASSSRGGADRNRVGEALDAWLETGGVGTSMLVGSAGGLASGSRAATVARRLQQLHEATTASFVAGGGAGGRDKQLKAAFSCLRLIGEAFALRDNVLERAKEITKDLMQESQQFPRARNNTTTMLAVTYLACREAGVTRTVKELVVYDRAISEKELGKAINRIKKQVPQRGDASSAESATQLLPRYCSRLQLSVHVSDVAEHVAKRAAQVIISSHRPNSIAGAAIWLVVQLLNSATNPHLPKAAEIASVTGAGEHTLRSIYKDMLDVAEHLLPGEFQPTVEGGLEGLRARNTSRKRKCIDGS